MAEEKKTAKKDTKKAEDTKTTKSDIEIKPGMTVRVHEIIREKNAKGEEKQRTQIFEGIILAKKHRKEVKRPIARGATKPLSTVSSLA